VLTSAKRRRRPAATRAAILRAARRLYFAHGPEGVSARKIAEAVGVSPTAIYLYFRSIGDLLEHLRMEGHAVLSARLREAGAGRPALERVRAMGREYLRFGVEHPQYYALMFRLRAVETPRREAVQREMYTLMLLRDVVQSGVERGEMRRDLDVMVVTNVLWANIHGLTALALSGLLVESAPGQQEAVLEGMLDSAVAWLAPPPSVQR
jgi:AcrR family transcriptional regulator